MREAISALSAYYYALYLCLVRGAKYFSLPRDMPAESRLFVYSLVLHIRLFSAPHYRSGTFGNDARKNLRNVALPGTGLPLSALCHSRLLAIAFLWIGVPLCALASAIIQTIKLRSSFATVFAEALLATGEGGRAWFHYWRLNCAIASYHALTTADEGYALEDKLVFLESCEREGVAVTPWLRQPRVIVKHRNEEGGLGLHLYSNAASGGDWIIQAALSNHSSLARVCARAGSLTPPPICTPPTPTVPHPAPLLLASSMNQTPADFHPLAPARFLLTPPSALSSRAPPSQLLPKDAPLSTLRLITASKASARPPTRSDGTADAGEPDDAILLSACFRAGREGATTDHSCIMFDMDVPAGRCKKGTSNSHWYQLGVGKAMRCPWYSEGHTIAEHPDTGFKVDGEAIPGMAEAVELVTRAHHKLMPRVPLVGWDVAITKEHGILLLEANLSCNFFRATFDLNEYTAFLESVLRFLEGGGQPEAPAAIPKKNL